MLESVHPLATKLAEHIAGEVRFDTPTRLIYSTDASNYQVMPLGVVLPKTKDDVIAAVKLCAEHGVSIIPRGGGSNLCGSAIGAGVVIDFTKYMDQVIAVDAATREARVQAGVILGQLNKQLAKQSLQFGPDPASAERASVGGVIGANATGSHSIRYGMTADNLNAVQAVLADGALAEFRAEESGKVRRGESGILTFPLSHFPTFSDIGTIVEQHSAAIYRDFPKVWRRASGYNADFTAEMLAYDAAHPMACLTAANAKRQGSNLDNHLRVVSQRNLAPLFAGAEGTLGVLTEATLNLFPKPKHTALVITTFESLLESVRHVPALLTLHPSAIELIGGMFIRLARDLPECKERIGWLEGQANPEGLLVIEFDGETETEARAGVERLAKLVAQEHLPCTLNPIFATKAQADVWFVRKIGLNVLTSIRSEYKPISVVEDVAVPVECLPEYVTRLNEIFALNNTEGAFYAHASAGVLHVRPLVNLRTAEGLAKMQDIGRRTLALCKEMSGAMSGEHGDGYERAHHTPMLFGDEVYAAFCAIKDAFDPQNLLNPGKKVRGVEMEHHLRLGPTYKTAPMQTTFTFHLDGSFARAVEQCNGSGVCRKLDAGVMCPSYRATREEMHSTRGRANLLREFIKEQRLEIGDLRLDAQISNPQSLVSNPQSPKPTIDEVRVALDLCLSCKACETECAAGVDMAKLKSEFTQHYYDENGTPLRAWALGRIAPLSVLATAFAPISNWTMRQSLFKRVMRVAPERTMPAFASHTFDDWWKKHQASNVKRQTSNVNPKSKAVLFVDTFTRYNHPQLGIDAVEVLERAGVEVIIPPWKCCGRPMLSQGQPKAMLDWARFNVAQLAPYAKQGIPILGLEPSCITALKDDYLDLIPGEDTGAVAKMTTSIEEFLIVDCGLSIAQSVPQRSSTIRNQKSEILLHGHCHQKASYGTKGTRAALAQAGCEVNEIDSTCCGMAGAFGYEAEHYALSQQVGELSVLPAVRNAPADVIIVAPGTSCRDQIQHFTGREALHPIQVIARRLREMDAQQVADAPAQSVDLTNANA
jgi:FAD/FMN-containing dehydrogenase/Fe-S oxidoreductase